ncbi:MAG: FRG domain-containing protein, partial [Anaerolineales bacterium]|nr:FRG domain-containing protein [Anaerolineales bacterium]
RLFFLLMLSLHSSMILPYCCVQFSVRTTFELEEIQGFDELKWKKYIQWSILQHYEVSYTPLLDFTHSLRVACSFAQINAYEGEGFVYIFGLPYIMNRVSHNSEHDIVNVRLLSICPPEALRPYFQEGYLAGTEDITDEYDSKDILDFNNRLIAKFRIPSQAKFWGTGFSRIPKNVLYPKRDRIGKLCESISLELKSQLLPGQLGEFLQEWTELEESLIGRARDQDQRVFSNVEAIDALGESGLIDQEIIYELHELRKFRNVVVHEPKKITQDQIEEKIEQIRKIKPKLRKVI